MAITLTAGDIFGAAAGYARAASAFGAVGSISGEPFAGFTVNYLISSATPSLDALTLVGDTTATFTTMSFTVNGNTWTIGTGVYSSGSGVTEYPLTTSGGEFVVGNSYTVDVGGAGSQTLTPSLFTNTQTFYAPTVLGPVTLLPALFSNTSAFYRSIVYAGHTADGDFPFKSVWLADGRRRLNPQPRKITGLAATNSAHPAVWTDWLFFPATGGQTLAPSLLTNSQSFYTPTVTRGAVSLAPSLFTNTQTFYAATVSRGAVTLSPSLLTNSQSFPAATVTATCTLAPALLTNAQTFYGPTVSPGAVTLAPTLLSNTQNFYAPTVTQSAIVLSPSLVVNAQSFFSPTVAASNAVSPPLVSNAQSFYAPTVSSRKTLTPPLYANDNSFFPAAVSLANQVLRPDLFVNGASQPDRRMWRPFMGSFAA